MKEGWERRRRRTEQGRFWQRRFNMQISQILVVFDPLLLFLCKLFECIFVALLEPPHFCSDIIYTSPPSWLGPPCLLPFHTVSHQTAVLLSVKKSFVRFFKRRRRGRCRRFERERERETEREREREGCLSPLSWTS